jgi:hypothetical protein
MFWTQLIKPIFAIRNKKAWILFISNKIYFKLLIPPGLIHFLHFSAMHNTVCPLSPFISWNGSYGWKTCLLALNRQLDLSMRPAATFNLTPYSMLCSLIIFWGHFICLPYYFSQAFELLRRAQHWSHTAQGMVPSKFSIFYLSLCECAESAPSLGWEDC